MGPGGSDPSTGPFPDGSAALRDVGYANRSFNARSPREQQYGDNFLNHVGHDRTRPHNEGMELQTSRPRLIPRSLAKLLPGVIMVSAALAGCNPAFLGAPPCMPPSYSVNPSSVKIGETVTVQAQDSDCDPRYGADARVHVTVTDANGKKILSTTAPMNDAGSFTYSFEIPVQATPGKAAVEAYPHNIDWCDDTGKNNRVSAAEVSVVRASCAARIEPFTITS